MERAEIIQYLALTRLRNIGSVLAKNLITYFKGIEPIFSASKAELEKVLGIGNIIAVNIVESRVEALQWAEQELKWIEEQNITPFIITEKNYSYRLRECLDSPVVLYAKGNVSFNNGKYLGIVGTRRMSPYGRNLVRDLIEGIAAVRKDVTIVSGLAYGVDITAHKAALECGLPTIGVTAHGLHTIYPSEHKKVAEQMLEQGGIVTEFGNGTIPFAANFVQRNRIIAGLCDAVVVAESGKNGGSLITAEFASEYNRDVYAFPGRVGDSNSEGCNNLIMYNKAALIQHADDLLRNMNWDISKEKVQQQSINFDILTPEEQGIIALLRQNHETHINDIARATGIPLAKLSSLLIRMEFEGKIKCLPGSTYQSQI